MAKFRSIKNSLIAGEISPTALGRTDLAQYPHACKTLKNVIPFLSGGGYGRPGTFFESSIDATTDYAPRLIEFIVSKTEAYCLSFSKVIGGDGTISFFRATSNKALSESGLVTGNHPYEIAEVGNSVGTYDEIHDLQYVQSADILYLVHPNHIPARVTRTARDTFEFADFDDGLTGTTLRDAWPYRPQNATAITITPSATSGTGITLTASAAFFDSGHVGSLVKLDHTGTIGCARITAFTDSTHVTADVVVNFGGTTAVATWWESAWSDYRGWPRAIAFFQQRLGYFGNLSEPDTIWFSETNDFNQLSHDSILDPRSSPTGTQAFTLTLASEQLNEIQWASSSKNLIVGTRGEEWIIDREDITGGSFGADGAIATRESAYGSSYHKAIRVGNELMFVSASDDEVKALVFNEIESSYVADPVQLLYNEYPKIEPETGNRKFRALAWDASRSTLWACDTAGNIFGMTHDRRLQVTSWHSHQMGGFDSELTGEALGSGLTQTTDPAYTACAGSVISLAVVPNPVIGTDDLWMAVKRKINGSFEYHIERMIGKFVAYDTAYSLVQNGVGNYLVDGAVFSVNDFPTTEDFVFNSGLDHLEGETPEGTAFNTKGIFKVTGSAVSSGSTTLQKPYPSNIAGELTVVVFGFPFDSIIEPVVQEAGSVIGTSQGATKRLHKAEIRFYKTLCAKVGGNADNLEKLIFRNASTPMQNSAELYTGLKEVRVDSDYQKDESLYILKDEPLPFAFVSAICEGVTYD